MRKYETGLFKRPEEMIFRKIEVEGKTRTYYLMVSRPNIADSIYVDPHDPNSRGFGGSLLQFTLEDGTVDEVKGPWHTGANALLNDTGMDIRDLHATQVTIWSTKPGIWRGKGYETVDGKLVWTDVEREIFEKDEILYHEEVPALGIFMRGERIAHAYAKATGKTVYLRSESSGGSSEHQVGPDSKMHPMAERHE